MLNIDNKISTLPIRRYTSFCFTHFFNIWCRRGLVGNQSGSVTVHLRNPNKQQLIVTKFHVDSASFVGNQNAKFQ